MTRQKINPQQCDVLVVGGGPAGGAAARKAAELGADVLLVERKSVIGEPVQCAEFIPAMLKGTVNVKQKYVAQKIAGMKTVCPGEKETVTRAPGFIIHRQIFDRALVRAARDQGARVMTRTRAIERRDSGEVLLKEKTGQTTAVRPRIIIGADGPHSTVGKWAGAVNRHLLPGVQVTMELVKPLDHTHVYFRPDIYAGYGWLFPKNNHANVGLGLRPGENSNGSIRDILDRFVTALKNSGKIKGAPKGYVAGWIPAEPVRKTVYGSIALVGDAAGHTHPITGAGIFAAVVGGEMAGKWAARSVNENDASLLNRYDQEWQDLMADTLSRAHQRRLHMEARWEDFNTTIKRCWVAFREYYE